MNDGPKLPKKPTTNEALLPINAGTIRTSKELEEALKCLYGQQKDNPSAKPFKYIIYARKSTEDADKQVRSLGDQLSECFDYAERNSLLLGKPNYIKESASAKQSDKRPGFRAMIEAIKKGQYDGIIAWHPDRLSRNMKDAGEIIDLLDRGTIKDLRFVSFNFENTPSGKMHLGITFVLSKQYSDQLSVNVSRGIGHSIKGGAYINRPKHGYFKDSEQYLRPDGRNHALIKDAFRLRLEGGTFQQIADYLNSQHYERAYADGSRKPFKWTKQTMQKTLRDPVFAGVVEYGNGHIADLTEMYDFETAVGVEEFVKINNLTGGRKELVKLARSYNKGADVKANLLRGIILCSECGESRSAGITSKKEKRGTVNYFYYRCDTHGCKLRNTSTRAKVIIKFVTEFLAQKPFSSKEAYDHYAEEMKQTLADRGKERRALLSTLLGKEKELSGKQARIKEFILDAGNTDFVEGFKGDLREAENQHKQAQADIEKTKTLIANEKAAILLFPEFLEQMEKITQIIASTRSMPELDFCIKKMFSNFSIDRKNVVNATLAEPFAGLFGTKVIKGGR